MAEKRTPKTEKKGDRCSGPPKKLSKILPINTRNDLRFAEDFFIQNLPIAGEFLLGTRKVFFKTFSGGRGGARWKIIKQKEAELFYFEVPF
jgi:hypothetical protein